MIVEKRTATLLDAVYIAENLREQDHREVVASNGPDVRKAVVDSLLASEEAFVWTVDGRPACIAGVSRMDMPGPFTGAGAPWMLGTPEMVGHAKMLIRDARVWVKDQLERFPLLFNFVHVENTTSILWLKRLGFRFSDLIHEYGANKQPFILFYRYSNA